MAVGTAERLMPAAFLLCSVDTNERLLASSAHPVAKDAGASVGGLDLPDVGQVDLFGENEQQQTLHPYRCDLRGKKHLPSYCSISLGSI